MPRAAPKCSPAQLGQLRRAFGSIFLILNLEQQCEQLVRQFLGRFVLLFQPIADLLLNLSVRWRSAITPTGLNAGVVVGSHRYISDTSAHLINGAVIGLFRELREN